MYAYSYMHIYTHMSYDAIACHSISCHIMPYCRIIAYDEQYSVACHINSSYHSVCVCVLCYIIRAGRRRPPRASPRARGRAPSRR